MKGKIKLALALGLVILATGCHKKPAEPDPAVLALQATQATETQNKKVIEAWAEAMNHGDLAYLEKVIHPDFVDHAAFPGYPPTKAGYLDLMKLAQAEWFGNMHVNLLNTVAEGDLVMIRVDASAVHKGTVMGAKPTGKELKWASWGLYRLKDGMLIERWEQLDSFAFMSQLGLAKMAQ